MGRAKTAPGGARHDLIIQRYLLREVLQSVAAVLCVLMLVYSSNRFVRFLTEAALGRTSTDLLFEMLLLKLAANLALLVPVALFFGAMFALGRLQRDSEIVAMTAGGVGTRAIALTMLGISLAVALVTAALSLYVSPTVLKQYDRVRDRAKESYQISGVLPGRFKAFDNGEKVVYAGGLSDDRRVLLDVFVHVRSPDSQDLLVAARAYQSVLGLEGDRFIVLEDGYRYSGEPGSVDYVITYFAKHAIKVELARAESEIGTLDATSTRALWRSSDPAYASELQWRLSLPLSAVVFGFLALPLSRGLPREGRYGRLFLAVLVYFAYNNAVGVAQKLVERGDLTPLVGVWPVHLAMMGIALGVLYVQGSGGWRGARRARWRRAAVR